MIAAITARRSAVADDSDSDDGGWDEDDDDVKAERAAAQEKRAKQEKSAIDAAKAFVAPASVQPHLSRAQQEAEKARQEKEAAAHRKRQQDKDRDERRAALNEEKEQREAEARREQERLEQEAAAERARREQEAAAERAKRMAAAPVSLFADAEEVDLFGNPRPSAPPPLPTAAVSRPIAPPLPPYSPPTSVMSLSSQPVDETSSDVGSDASSFELVHASPVDASDYAREDDEEDEEKREWEDDQQQQQQQPVDATTRREAASDAILFLARHPNVADQDMRRRLIDMLRAATAPRQPRHTLACLEGRIEKQLWAARDQLETALTHAIDVDSLAVDLDDLASNNVRSAEDGCDPSSPHVNASESEMTPVAFPGNRETGTSREAAGGKEGGDANARTQSQPPPLHPITLLLLVQAVAY